MTNNEKMTELIDSCIIDLIGSAGRVNEYSEKKDFGRNHTNYGYASKSADVLRMLGKKVSIDNYSDDEGYLIIPRIVIDSRVTEFKY
jgi:hypothetical protein